MCSVQISRKAKQYPKAKQQVLKHESCKGMAKPEGEAHAGKRSLKRDFHSNKKNVSSKPGTISSNKVRHPSKHARKKVEIVSTFYSARML